MHFFFQETKIISRPIKQTSLAFNSGNWKRHKQKASKGNNKSAKISEIENMSSAKEKCC